MSLYPVGPNPAVHVRPATDQDVTFLVDVVLVTARAQGGVPDDFDEPAWRASFADETLRRVTGDVAHDATYVVEIAGARAGRLRIVREPDHRDLAGLELLPAHQGKGLGTHLIEQFLVDARDQGLAARVRVRRDNERARSLLERLGFVEVGPAEGADPIADGDVRMEWRS